MCGFGGLQDNETIIYSGNLAWAETGMIGDGDGAVINPVNTNIVYADSNAGGIYKSTAGGASALRRSDIGTLAPGSHGDLAVVTGEHWVDLAYHPGEDVIAATVKDGVVVHGG